VSDRAVTAASATSPRSHPAPRRLARIAGPLALAALFATLLLAAMAITVLATAETRVRAAVETQRRLDEAVQEAAACAAAFASQSAAWKSYLLAEVWNDGRASTRAKGALATASGELSERLERLTELGAKAQLPTDGATIAAQSASAATNLLVESIADTRGADDDALAEVDRRTLASLEQVRHELFGVNQDWSARASAFRVEATSAAADSARRFKAWIEILSLLAVVLVVTLGALAVRKDASHGGA